MKFFKAVAIAATCLTLVAGVGVSSTQAATQGINPLQSPQPTAVPTTPPTGGQVICTVLRGVTLNVRSGPSTSNRVIGRLAGGRSFVCLSRRGNWLSLRINGRIGWVYRPLVRCNRAI